MDHLRGAGHCPNLQVAFDYFDIDLAEEISRIGPQQTADNCVNVDSINNQFCSFVTRDGTGNIREISDSYVNVAGLKIRGFDLQATYDFEVTDVLSLFGNEAQRDLGSVRLNFVGTKNIDNQFIDRDIITDEESLTESVGRSFLPEYRLITSANYSSGEFGARWQARYASETQTNVPLTQANIDARGDFVNIPEIWYHYASVYYNLPDRGVRIYGGVNNVFDEGPRDHPFTVRGTNMEASKNRTFCGMI